MSIIKWSPFDAESWMDDELGVSFPLGKLGWDLAVDVYEDKKGDIVAEMHVPGVIGDKIDISIEDDILRISGCREEKEEKKDKNFYQKEIKKGSFERVVRLPAPVESDKSYAESENGVLKIVMPKKKASKSEKVKVKVK